MDHAACVAACAAGWAEPDDWFPARDIDGAYGQARAICLGCPVRFECVAAAIAPDPDRQLPPDTRPKSRPNAHLIRRVY
jgi:Transcription factor WhiB